jgi:hypothetical protein
MSAPLQYVTEEYLAPFRNKRPNETHVADTISVPDNTLGLEQNLQMFIGGAPMQFSRKEISNRKANQVSQHNDDFINISISHD